MALPASFFAAGYSPEWDGYESPACPKCHYMLFVSEESNAAGLCNRCVSEESPHDWYYTEDAPPFPTLTSLPSG